MDKVDYISSKEISEIFKILSHPLRVSIITQLNDRSMNYTTLQQNLGNPSTGTLNFHLKKMQPLLEKEGEKYKLNLLGQKSIELIDQYKNERDNVNNHKIIQQDIDYWSEFLELNEMFAPGIMVIGVFILGLVLRIATEFGTNYDLNNLILFLGLIPLVRWMWEKVYTSSQPTSTLIFMYLTYLISFTFLILYRLFSSPHNWDVFGEITRYGPSNSVISFYENFIFTLGEIRRNNIDLDIYVLIFILVPLITLLWAYLSFNELPSFQSIIKEADDLVVSTELSPNIKHIMIVFISIILADILFMVVIMVIVDTIRAETQLYFLLAQVQLILFGLLFILKCGFVLLADMNGLNVRGVVKSNLLIPIVVTLIIVEIIMINNIFNKLEQNLVEITDTSFLRIDLSLIAVIIIYLNLLFGLLTFAYDHYLRDVPIKILHKKTIISFSLLLTWLIVLSVNNNFVSLDRYPQILEFGSIVFTFIIVGNISKIPSNSHWKQVIMLFPYVSLSIIVSIIEIFGSGQFNSNDIGTVIVDSIFVILIGYYGSRLFSDI